MLRTMRVATVLALAGVAAGCVAPGTPVESSRTGGLRAPTFAPLTPSPTGTPDARTPEPPSTTDPAPASRSRTATPTPSTTPPVTNHTSPSDVPPTAVRGRIDDGTGDLQGVRAGSAPAHADLRGLVLERGPESVTITITFAGPAPERAEGDEVVNVATYHDVTGDGRVDHEIWASLTAEGWGTAWYDLREGSARFAAEDGVDVEVVDGTVVLAFPPGHLDGARSGRWLASSEWGTPLAVSSGTSTTDDAPDDRSGQPWPS